MSNEHYIQPDFIPKKSRNREKRVNREARKYYDDDRDEEIIEMPSTLNSSNTAKEKSFTERFLSGNAAIIVIFAIILIIIGCLILWYMSRDTKSKAADKVPTVNKVVAQHKKDNPPENTLPAEDEEMQESREQEPRRGQETPPPQTENVVPDTHEEIIKTADDDELNSYINMDNDDK